MVVLRKRLKNEFYIETGGFSIRFVLNEAENSYFKENLIDLINKVWGKGGFLRESSKKWDFEVVVNSSEGRIEIIKRDGGRKYFSLSFIKDFKEKRISTFYHVGFANLQFVLKEILCHLISKDGFLLHASSVLDEQGKLHVFLGPQEVGKSTLANNLAKSKGLVKFSDDALLVRRMGSKWSFYSPPFVEKEALPIKRISTEARVYFIKRGKQPAKKALSPQQALKLFIPQIWLSNAKLRGEILKNALDFILQNKPLLLTVSLDKTKMRKILYED